MNTNIQQPVALSCVFMWVGFVCAISFMEAWLKFRAPGVTLSVGLGIGKLVFSMLNKIEWVFALVVGSSVIIHSGGVLKHQYLWPAASISILLIQTTWLLPALNARADLYIQGRAMTPSWLHIGYVCCETAKVICLLTTGISMFKPW